MANCLSFWKNKKYFQNLIMRRDICNLQVNEASFERAQMWSGICYMKPWQVKRVVSCPLKQLRMPPALHCARSPSVTLGKRFKMKHDSCSLTCNVTFAVSKKKQRALNSQWTDFSVYWAEFPDAALGVFNTKMYKSQFREESSYTDMAVVPGEQPKQTPGEQRYPPGDQKGFQPGLFQFRQNREFLSHVFNTETMHSWQELVGSPFSKFHWKNWVVVTVASYYLLN